MMLNNILIHIMIHNQTMMQIQSLVMTQCNLHTSLYSPYIYVCVYFIGSGSVNGHVLSDHVPSIQEDG